MMERPTDSSDIEPIDGPPRDTVTPLVTGDEHPTIVSISDIHGYLEPARSALQTVGDHEDYPPLVSGDDDGNLHWAGDDQYVLVFNGDLVDRGPRNEGVLELVGRLRSEAPPGHVRVTFGNHEMGVLAQDLFRWSRWFSGKVTDHGRKGLCEDIANGHLVAAYDGYNVTYAHAGLVDPYETTAVNDNLAAAAERVVDAIGTDRDAAVQEAVIGEYPAVLGLGAGGGRGEGAGIAWLDFQHMPPKAPPQVVGHTRHETPTQNGNVICENVIRATRSRPGGEAVVLESPDSIRALIRTADGGVEEHEFASVGDGPLK
jgi:hypothetical protein